MNSKFQNDAVYDVPFIIARQFCKMKKAKNGKPKKGFRAFSALEWEKIRSSRTENVQGEEFFALAKVRMISY